MNRQINNKQIVRAYIEKVVNTGDVSSIDNYISEDYTEVYQQNRNAIGIVGAASHIKGVRETYPDLSLTIEDQVAEGDWVVTCYTMQGTHSGKWMGIKPTGKRITVTGINKDRVVNGKIAEHGGAANMLEGLLTIGAIQLAEKDSSNS